MSLASVRSERSGSHPDAPPFVDALPLPLALSAVLPTAIRSVVRIGLTEEVSIDAVSLASIFPSGTCSAQKILAMRDKLKM